MASFDRGTKRQCLHCGTKFYDLTKNPILCPSCGKVFVAEAVAQRAATRYEKAKEVEEVEEVDVEEAAEEAGAEIVSLEDADAEEAGEEDIPEVEGVEEVEDIGEDDDDTFLEEEDDDDDDLDFEVPADER